MREHFSQLISELCYRFSLAEIKVQNQKQEDLSHNSALYKKIICKESGKHTISSIAKLLSVKTTAVTQKVNELEQKQYVTRKQCDEDKRISYLYGVERFCPCKEEFLKRDEYVFQGLKAEYTEEEIAKFLEILQSATDKFKHFDSKEVE